MVCGARRRVGRERSGRRGRFADPGRSGTHIDRAAGYDRVHTAVKHSSIGWISSAEYAAFCEAYGADVTTWEDYELLRDIREFRMTCGAAQLAAKDPALKAQANHRLACIRGERGQRLWAGWTCQQCPTSDLVDGIGQRRRSVAATARIDPTT